jgi:hypothetical protein
VILSLVLISVAVPASYIPARRAAEVDPWSPCDTNKSAGLSFDSIQSFDSTRSLGNGNAVRLRLSFRV